MRPFVASILAVLLLVPAWSGQERLPLLDRDFRLRAVPLRIDGAIRRFGRLELVGAMVLTGNSPAFGGFSAIAVRDGRVTLLNDGGNWIDFALRRGVPYAAKSGYLAEGPGTGWQKRDRDSESLAVDPATGSIWVGFEGANEIWRYAPGLARAEMRRAPQEMRRWPVNGGAESLVRLRDGRLLVLAERDRRRRAPRPGLIFSSEGEMALRRFAYRPPAGYDASDAAELPGGDILILNRRFTLPFRFSAKLTLVPRGAIERGGIVSGHEIATLDAPGLRENWEGVAVTRERGATILWLVSDEDEALLQKTVLAKFRVR